MLFSSCQDLKDNVAMNKDLFMSKTKCFDGIEGVKEAHMAVCILKCLRPILDKYPKLTHIGLQYKDDRTEEREKLEAYDVLVKKEEL